MPGVSCFLREGEEIFHTYSAHARGTDAIVGAYSLVDLTALGRQEDWEEPKGGWLRSAAATRRSPADVFGTPFY